MTKQEKIDVILEAAKTYPNSKIDKAGKGKAVKKLQDGQNVTEAKIDEMVACLQTLQAVAPIQEVNLESNQTIEQNQNKVEQKVAQSEVEQNQNKVEQNEGEDSQIMMHRITQLEEALARKDEQIRAFEERLSKVEGCREQSAQSTEQREDSRILGFRLLKKKTYTKWQDQQLCYEKWYAVKGKKVVYLGDAPQDAENKIKSYCQRRGFSLESKVMA